MKDIFCQINQKLRKQIIDQSTHFFLIHDGYPLLEGHLLLVPKKHLDCYLNLDKKLINEFLAFKEKIIQFLRKAYQEPVIFEHGIIGQTVFHAHLHFLPTNLLIYKKIEEYATLLSSPKIPYLYYEFKGQKNFYATKKVIPLGFFHLFYAQFLKRPLKGEERKLNLPSWLLKVKEKYNLYGKKR